MTSDVLPSLGTLAKAAGIDPLDRATMEWPTLVKIETGP